MSKQKSRRSKKTAPKVEKPKIWTLKSQDLSLQQKGIMGLVLGLLAFLLYSPSLNFEYVFDDDVYTQKNRITSAGLDSLNQIFGKGSVYGFSNENYGTYRPITLLTFALEKDKRRSFKPQKSHRNNLLLYSLTVFVIFILLTQLFSRRNCLLPIGICLLFLAHPVHIEAVANVKGREEILVLLFGAISLLSLFQFQDGKKWYWMLLAVLLYCLALMSKENAYTLLMVVPTMLFLFSRANWKQILWQTTIFFAITFFFYELRLVIFDRVPKGAGAGDPYINNFLMAASGMSQKLATELVILGKYLQLLIFPHPLSYDYSFNQFPLFQWVNWQVWASLLAYLSIGAYGIRTLIQRKGISFGVWFFLFTLSTAALSPLMFRNVASIGERFLFTPSLGFCIVLVIGITKVVKRFFSSHYLRPVMLIQGLIFLLYVVKLQTHLPIWESKDTLFSAGVEQAPNSFRAHKNLAEIRREDAERNPNPQQKKPLFEEAIRHYERSHEIYSNDGISWYNLGVCYLGVGRQEDAFQAFIAALERNPDHENAANNLGVIYFRRKDYVQARRYFMQALNANPTNGDYLANVGAVAQSEGDLATAVQYYEKAVNANKNPNALKNIIRIYQQLGDADKVAYYQSLAR